MTPAEQQTSLRNLKLERDATLLYEGLEARERDARRRVAFRTIASNERRHAAIWAARLDSAGVAVPAPPTRPRARIAFILLVARVLGSRAVADLVRTVEGDEQEAYLMQDDPEVASIIDDERTHAEMWDGFARPGRDAGPEPVLIATPTRDQVTSSAADSATVAQLSHASLMDPSASEPWHRGGQSGTLRATIFGVSDGLVSNLSIVMGVVGASASNRFIVVAGIAGLLAGAISMGAGEWISMTSQKELFERQIELEREEIRIMPDREELELAAVYHRKGIPPEDALRLAHRLMADPTVALDTKVREELGLDPDELGSPWGAASSSLLSFAAGAAVPLVPFLVSAGRPAFVGAVILSSIALFAVGAGVSLVTGRHLVYSGVRQVLIGAFAAAVTFGVGSLIGVAVA
ncbi:MAG TPA: VIT1/CCC1 transporter family protein [Candidatus Limnocylindrales bacterium]